ncbi:hypothetical protein [Nostoc sp.]|uniref:hypothetical protein n=1 Tax=Nostoc sp. TaxID=1180 RepID=UPI002FF73AFD
MELYTRFGFEEGLDTFFAYGLFAIAREVDVFPSIFTRDGNTHHIGLFVNWFTAQTCPFKVGKNFGQKISYLCVAPVASPVGDAARTSRGTRPTHWLLCASAVK